MARATLVTIPFSHFCEKARWALDRAGVAYVEEGHVPGLHRIAVKRAGSPGTSVPLLVDEGRVFTSSTDILRYADASAPPDRRVYPTSAGALADVAALVEELDREIGPHLRRVLYFSLLPRRRLVLDLFDQRTPAWERALVRVLFPILRAGMRRFMRISPATAASSRDDVRRAYDSVEARLADGRPYLFGDRFTAADLTLAALTSPCVQPAESTVRFPSPEELPEPAASLVRETRERPLGAYVRRVYREHRRPLA